MRDAGQWAKDALAAWREAQRADTTVADGFETRMSALILKAQLDAISQCARICRLVGNDSPTRERAAADRCLDEISNLVVSLTNGARRT